jgi:hypothetical protein
LDKENGNWKGSTNGKVATERVQMGRWQKKKGKATGGIITGVKLGLKKNDKKRENNKWWKIMIIYSKGMKTTRRQTKNVWLWEGTSTGK